MLLNGNRFGEEHKTERVDIAIRWTGGSETRVQTVRPVARMRQRSDYAKIVSRVRELVAAGGTSNAIGAVLTAEGFSPGRCQPRFSGQAVLRLMCREGITPHRPGVRHEDPLLKFMGPHEWTMKSFARRLDMPASTLHRWRKYDMIQVRDVTIGRSHRWVIHADDADIHRLEQYRSTPHAELARKRWRGACHQETIGAQDS